MNTPASSAGGPVWYPLTITYVENGNMATVHFMAIGNHQKFTGFKGANFSALANYPDNVFMLMLEIQP